MSNKILNQSYETLCLCFCCLFLTRLRDTCYGNRYRKTDNSRAIVARSAWGPLEEDLNLDFKHA